MHFFPSLFSRTERNANKMISYIYDSLWLYTNNVMDRESYATDDELLMYLASCIVIPFSECSHTPYPNTQASLNMKLGSCVLNAGVSGSVFHCKLSVS